ncbi:MAG: hypothetical protein PHQ12_10865, partial [Chthoniobacteraceae bacterium]|nr:hypothetical protein [Chthoniobacteraceae bacterium]
MNAGKLPSITQSANNAGKGHGIEWVRRFWPLWLLLGLVAVFFWDSIFAHKVLCLRDPAYGLLNAPQFVSKALKTHEFFPLWNPFIGHGKPHLADPESAFFYPIHWLYYLLPVSRALVMSYSFCVAMTGISVFALARHWKLGVFPSLCGAVSMMFSTWLIATIEFRAHSSTFTWGPLEWLIVSSLIERSRNEATAGVAKNFWRIVALAGTISLQYFAGYPQAMLYAQLFIGLYIGARCLWLRDGKLPLRMGLPLGLAGVITAGLCMAQFLPSWQFIQYSERGISIDPGLEMASFHPRQLLTLLFPYLYGRTGYPQEYWGPTMFEFWLGTCYIGIFPLIAATFSPFCLKRFTGKDGNELHRFLFFFCCGAAGLGLLLAAGKYTPVYMACYNFLPGFGHFRWPSKFLVFLLYTLCILSALGLQQLLDWKRRGRYPKAVPGLLFAWFMLLASAGIGYVLAQGSPGFFGALTGDHFI